MEHLNWPSLIIAVLGTKSRLSHVQAMYVNN